MKFYTISPIHQQGLRYHLPQRRGHIICTGEKTKIKKNEVSHVRSPEELMSEFGLKFQSPYSPSSTLSTGPWGIYNSFTNLLSSSTHSHAPRFTLLQSHEKSRCPPNTMSCSLLHLCFCIYSSLDFRDTFLLALLDYPYSSFKTHLLFKMFPKSSLHPGFQAILGQPSSFLLEFLIRFNLAFYTGLQFTLQVQALF